MNTVFLLRHGENHANITREFSYRLVDYSLTEKGVTQAKQAGEYIKTLQLDAIYASPLKRAVETAEIVAQACGLPVVNTLEELRELNVGSLEGQAPTAELWAQHDAVWDRWFAGELTARFPDGESYLEASGRLRQAVTRALEHVSGVGQGKRVLLVGHGGIFMMGTHALVEGLSVETLNRGYFQCSLSEITFEMDTPFGQLQRWNDHHYLHGVALEPSPKPAWMVSPAS